jgi:hypothetical protein
MEKFNLTANNPPPPVACFVRALGVDKEMDILPMWGRGEVKGNFIKCFVIGGVMAEMKQWRCSNNHILGFIRWNGNGLPQLMVMRKALDMDTEHPEDVDVLGPLDGRMPIKCSICDDVKVWEISIASLVALFMQLDDATVFGFSQKLLELSRSTSEVSDGKVDG